MAKRKRLIASLDQIRARLADAPRALAFHPGGDFVTWKAQFKAKILELLGPFPDPVPLNAEVVEEVVVDDFEDAGIPAFTQQKVVFDSEPYASVVAYLLIPQCADGRERRPAILNAHGHGSGKSEMVGLDPKCYLPGSDAPTISAAALHLVKTGFVVLAPDWRPFGERSLDSVFARAGRDPCNVTYMSFGYFGVNLLALNIWDAQRSLDYLEKLPFIDPDRIGMVGLSYGGTLTTYATALDDRVKAAVVSGYCSTLNDAMSLRGKGNYCGSQYLPGLLQWGDIPDVVGLIAPRPLLIESGSLDDCFVIEDTNLAYEELQEIYAAAGATDKLERDIADVPHQYIFHKLVPFLQNYL